MKKRTKFAAGAGAALAVVGAGAAIGATQTTPREESKAVLADAAKQLGVDPTKLSTALKQALKNRIDAAVEAGTLTKEQGAAMKERLESGDFPLFAGPALGGHPHRLGHHGFADLSAAASFLGISESALHDQLESGKTLAGIAKAKGKSVDDLVQALVKATTKRLDEAVADDRLTKAQRDEIAAGLEQRTKDAVNGVLPRLREHGRGFGMRGSGFGGFGSPDGPLRPGFFAPGAEQQPPAA